MAGPTQDIAAATPAGRSVRPSLLTCMAVSLIVLWIAAFVMPMADVPAIILHPALPPTILSFLACCLWSVFLLTRVRRHGVKFVSPLLICGLTIAVLAYAPFTQMWLQGNFWWHLADRDHIVARIAAGVVQPRPKV